MYPQMLAFLNGNQAARAFRQAGVDVVGTVALIANRLARLVNVSVRGQAEKEVVGECPGIDDNAFQYGFVDHAFAPCEIKRARNALMEVRFWLTVGCGTKSIPLLRRLYHAVHYSVKH